jgi:tetratricopeptide (TPR) repeat protein
VKFDIRNRETARVFAICVLLAALVWGVFGQTVRFEFINYDDLFVYQTPEVVKGLTLDGIGWAFTHTQIVNWIPLSTLSHMIDCQFYGLWAGGHHLTNVLLHATGAVLLFLVLRQMTGALWRSAFVAALFAIHPLHVESVAWVIERKDVLSGIFFMLTLGAYARYARRPESRLSYAMVLVCFALGLMSKPMLVTLPFILILLDYWPLGRFHNASEFMALLKEKIPLFVFSILASIGELFAARKDIQPIKLSFLPRLCNALVAYIIYIGKLVHPSQLAVYYPLSKEGPPVWQAIAATLLLIALSAGAWVLRRKQPYLLVGWLWYLGMLAPVIGIVPIGLFAYADRYTYLPQIGLCLGGTWAAADWAGACRHRRMLLAAAAAVALLFFAVAAHRQTSYWRDSVALWTHTLECTQGNALTHFILGDALVTHGREEEGLAQMREALRLNPNYAKAHSYLGQTMIAHGRTDEGIAELREALKIDPTDESAHYNLGKILLARGQTDGGITELREFLRKQPADADVHNTLGIALFQRGQTEQGIAEFREALELDPGDAQIHNNLAKALLEQGRTGEAIAEAQRALDLQPGNGAFQNNLAWMLATAQPASLRDGARAVSLATQAGKSMGGKNPNVLRTLAAAYAEEGKYPDAVQTARSASQLVGTGELADTLRRDIKLYETGQSLPDGQ